MIRSWWNGIRRWAAEAAISSLALIPVHSPEGLHNAVRRLRRGLRDVRDSVTRHRRSWPDVGCGGIIGADGVPERMAPLQADHLIGCMVRMLGVKRAPSRGSLAGCSPTISRRRGRWAFRSAWRVHTRTAPTSALQEAEAFADQMREIDAGPSYVRSRVRSPGPCPSRRVDDRAYCAVTVAGPAGGDWVGAPTPEATPLPIPHSRSIDR